MQALIVLCNVKKNKKMKKSIAIVLFCAALACACGGREDTPCGDIAVIRLDGVEPEEVKDYDISSWVDTSRFVISPLYTGDECLMSGQHERLFVVKDRVYVLDRKAQSVFIFRTDGSFVGKIHSPGSGPMDYTIAYDMFVTDKNILLLDIYGKKVLSYDLDGKFQYYFRMEGWYGTAIFCLGDRVYYLNKEQSQLPAGTYYLFSTDMRGGDLRKELPYKPREKRIPWGDSTDQPYVLSDQGVAYMKFLHNDTIYTVSADRPAAASYVLDLGKYTLPATYREQELRTFMTDEEVLGKYVLKVKRMRWINGYLVFSYLQGKPSKTHTVLYDPQAQRVAVNTRSLNMKQAFGESVPGILYNPGEGLIAHLGDSHLLWDLGAEDKTGRYGERYRGIVDTLSREANPVLFLYYLKPQP